jgi:hypothetical protein
MVAPMADPDPLAGAFDRVLTRLTIFNLDAPVPKPLVRALVDLFTFEKANSHPAIVDNGSGGRAIVWRGYLTGGLRTLYDRVAPMLDEHDLVGLLADPRLEVHVAAGADTVTIMGALADSITVDRSEWERRLERADDADALVQTFIIDRLNEGANDVLQAVRDRDDATRPALGSPPPDTLKQSPPGAVDFDMLEESTFHLGESYDPEGNITAAEVICHTFGGNWRTDILAPVVNDSDDERRDRWRAIQYRWITENEDDVEAEDEEEDDDFGEEPGRWSPSGRQELALDEVLQHLPQALHAWALDKTQYAIEALEEMIGDPIVPHAQEDRDALADQLQRAQAGSADDLGADPGSA